MPKLLGVGDHEINEAGEVRSSRPKEQGGEQTKSEVSGENSHCLVSRCLLVERDLGVLTLSLINSSGHAHVYAHVFAHTHTPCTPHSMLSILKHDTWYLHVLRDPCPVNRSKAPHMLTDQAAGLSVCFQLPSPTYLQGVPSSTEG